MAPLAHSRFFINDANRRTSGTEPEERRDSESSRRNKGTGLRGLHCARLSSRNNYVAKRDDISGHGATEKEWGPVSRSISYSSSRTDGLRAKFLCSLDEVLITELLGRCASLWWDRNA